MAHSPRPRRRSCWDTTPGWEAERFGRAEQTRAARWDSRLPSRSSPKRVRSSWNQTGEERGLHEGVRKRGRTQTRAPLRSGSSLETQRGESAMLFEHVIYPHGNDDRAPAALTSIRLMTSWESPDVGRTRYKRSRGGLLTSLRLRNGRLSQERVHNSLAKLVDSIAQQIGLHDDQRLCIGPRARCREAAHT